MWRARLPLSYKFLAMQQTVFLLLFISLVSSTIVQAQTDSLNLDFEEWVDSTLVNDSILFTLTEVHKIIDPYKGYYNNSLKNWSAQGPFYRTSDAVNGNYAAVISQWYSNVAGDLQIGTCNAGTMWHKKYCKNNLPIRPNTISGTYKFISEDSASAYATIICYRNNNGTGQLDTIAHTVFYFEPTNVYQPFTIPLSYIDTVSQMDSIHISFRTHNKFLGGILGPRLCADFFPLCNFLYLDNIKLNYQTSITDNIDNNLKVSIYPNPVKDNARVDINYTSPLSKMRLYTSTSRLLAEYTQTQEIHLESLQSGLYFLQFLFDDGYTYHHVLVKD